jgi:hypothetical protein
VRRPGVRALRSADVGQTGGNRVRQSHRGFAEATTETDGANPLFRRFCQAVLVAFFFARIVSAQDVPTEASDPTVTAYLRDVIRVESWSFFQPAEGPADPTYSLFANRATLGVRVSSPRFEFDGAFQYAQLLGLSERSLGPGALGSGGFYFFSAEAPAAYQLYFKALNLRVKDVLPGLSVAAGRMSYSSGEENSTGDAFLDDLKRRRIGSRLIGDFEWSVFQRSFDALRVDVDRRLWSANASLLFPTQGGYEESANPTMSAVKLVTASVAVKPALLGTHEMQFFGYHYRDHRDVPARPDNTVVGPRRADISLATFGASAVGSFTAGSGDVDTLVWTAAQTGDWYGQDHRAFSAAIEGGYRLQSAWRPWVRLGFLHASGDRDSSDGSHETFFQMLPSIQRYSQSTTYALMNLRDAFVEVALQPHHRVALRGELHRLSLVEGADRWYYGSGATSRDAPFFGFTTHLSGGGTRLGTIAELTADVSLRRVWSMNAYLGWMKGGEVVRRTFSGDRLVFFFVENVLAF